MCALLATVGLGWLAARFRHSARQRNAVAELRQLGGWVFYDCRYDESGNLTSTNSPGPAWLRTLVGVDFLSDVEGVKLTEVEKLEGFANFNSLAFFSRSCDKVSDAGLVHLERLSNVRWLALNRTQITDDGLVRFHGLRQLERLWLDDTQVTDAGLEHLKGLEDLQTLSLANTQITDAGLVHLQGMIQLRRLSLSGTQVTDAGLRHLTRLANLETLHLDQTDCSLSGVVRFGTVLQERSLSETLVTAKLAKRDDNGEVVSLDLSRIQVSDDGLMHLKGLKQLVWLYLQNTHVTDAGLETLGDLTSLTLLHLAGTQVTDAGLGHLLGLRNLRTLHLSGTKVTEEGAKQLKQDLPKRTRIYLVPVQMKSPAAG